MSSRVTRSAARLAVDPNSETTPAISTPVTASTRKRKAPDPQTSTPLHPSPGAETSTRSSTRKAKRPKINETPTAAATVVRSTRRRGAIAESEMSNSASSSKPTDDPSPNIDANAGASAAKRKSGRNKKPLQGLIAIFQPFNGLSLTWRQNPPLPLSHRHGGRRSELRKGNLILRKTLMKPQNQ